MMKEYDVTAFGEILIDFTAAGKSADGKNVYEVNPGGAPANCAAACAKLGGKSAFIGMTGEDSFGTDLRNALKSAGIETKGMRTTKEQHTTLAFVRLDSKGERNFSFCRNPGADTQMKPEDLDMEILNGTKFLQVGSLSLTAEPAASTTLKAIETVKAAGGFISYDPNWRAPLWNDKERGISCMKSLFKYADMVKVSDEEMELLYPELTLEEGAEAIRNEGVKLVLVTLGPDGVYYSAAGCSGKIGTKDVKVVDTTGAGDSFTGGLLYRLTRKENPFDFTKESLEKDLEFANAVASLCVTKRGAIPALPSLAETEAFLQNAD